MICTVFVAGAGVGEGDALCGAYGEAHPARKKPTRTKAKPERKRAMFTGRRAWNVLGLDPVVNA